MRLRAAGLRWRFLPRLLCAGIALVTARLPSLVVGPVSAAIASSKRSRSLLSWARISSIFKSMFLLQLRSDGDSVSAVLFQGRLSCNCKNVHMACNRLRLHVYKDVYF